MCPLAFLGARQLGDERRTVGSSNDAGRRTIANEAARRGVVTTQPRCMAHRSSLITAAHRLCDTRNLFLASPFPLHSIKAVQSLWYTRLAPRACYSFCQTYRSYLLAPLHGYHTIAERPKSEMLLTEDWLPNNTDSI